jgi:hypothetical protein
MVSSALQEAHSSCAAEREHAHAELSKELRQVNDLAGKAIEEHEQCKAFMRYVDEEGTKLAALRADGWRIARKIIEASSERDPHHHHQQQQQQKSKQDADCTDGPV